MATKGLLSINVDADHADITTVNSLLARNSGSTLRNRIEHAEQEAVEKYMLDPLKDAIPIGPGRRHAAGVVQPGGATRKSAHTKLLPARGQENIRPVWLGATDHAFWWLTHGTRDHDLYSNLASVQGKGELAHFADDEVRPLHAISVRGLKARDIIGKIVDRGTDAVTKAVEEEAFDTREHGGR